MSLRIDHETCTLCGRCVEDCPYGALEEIGGRIAVNDRCTLCGACVEWCPVEAIRLQPGHAGGDEGGGGAGAVWVYGELHDGRLHQVVFELLGKGGELARARNGSLELVAVGADLSGVADQLAGLPVRTVHLAEHPGLAGYLDGAHSRALAALIRRRRPEIVLAGATARGRSLMPRVAVLCRTGLTADCTGLEIDPETGNLLQTRPAFGGNVIATILTRRHRPQMATVRPRLMPEPVRQGNALPEVRRWRPPDELVEEPVEVLHRRAAEDGTVDLAEARVLVAGGRGLGGPEGFETLRKLADLLGGEIAASRAAVDAGWIPYSRQVGQTGKTVQPDLYLAVGISGAVQHRVGMQSSGTIVAINSDPEAPIFQVADYGVVGDYRALLPRLLDRLRKERGRE